MSGQDNPGGPDWWLASDGKWYPPQTPAPPAAGPGASAPGPGQDKSFFSKLFDTSMTSFITPSIVKVLFILGIIVISLYAVAVFAAFAAAGDGGVIFALLFAPLFWFLGILWLRVSIEVMVVFFRIEENTRKR